MAVKVCSSRYCSDHLHLKKLNRVPLDGSSSSSIIIYSTAATIFKMNEHQSTLSQTLEAILNVLRIMQYQ